MSEPEPIVVDVTSPVIRALARAATHLALVREDGSVVELDDRYVRTVRSSVYVSLAHAAELIGTAPAAVEELVRQGELDALTRSGHLLLSLQSVLDYECRQRNERREALDEMIRVSEEDGLYEAEVELL